MSTARRNGNRVRLFIGERIEHASDRDVLVTVYDALERAPSGPTYSPISTLTVVRLMLRSFPPQLRLLLKPRDIHNPSKAVSTAVGPRPERMAVDGYATGTLKP